MVFTDTIALEFDRLLNDMAIIRRMDLRIDHDYKHQSSDVYFEKPDTRARYYYHIQWSRETAVSLIIGAIDKDLPKPEWGVSQTTFAANRDAVKKTEEPRKTRTTRKPKVSPFDKINHCPRHWCMFFFLMCN